MKLIWYPPEWHKLPSIVYNNLTSCRCSTLISWMSLTLVHRVAHTPPLLFLILSSCVCSVERNLDCLLCAVGSVHSFLQCLLDRGAFSYEPQEHSSLRELPLKKAVMTLRLNHSYGPNNLRSSFRSRVIQLHAFCAAPLTGHKEAKLHLICPVCALAWTHGPP